MSKKVPCESVIMPWENIGTIHGVVYLAMDTSHAILVVAYSMVEPCTIWL